MSPTLLARVTDEVKGVLRAAQDEARRLGHGYIGTEHVLIALLEQGSSQGVKESRRQGATAEAARQSAREAFAAVEGSIPYVSDEEALDAVGVDLAEVRRRAEAEFGAEALPLRMGAPAFTPRVKAALEVATAVASGDGGQAGLDDLLLALMEDSGSVAARFLADTCGDLSRVAEAVRSGRL